MLSMAPITEDFPFLTFLPLSLPTVISGSQNMLDQPAATGHKLQILRFNLGALRHGIHLSPPLALPICKMGCRERLVLLSIWEVGEAV